MLKFFWYNILLVYCFRIQIPDVAFDELERGIDIMMKQYCFTYYGGNHAVQTNVYMSSVVANIK